MLDPVAGASDNGPVSVPYGGTVAPPTPRRDNVRRTPRPYLALFVLVAAVTPALSAAADLCSEGDALLHAKKFQEAAETFSQRIAQDPNDTRGHYGRGSARWHLRDYDGAIADFGRVAEMAPGAAGAWYMRGLALARKGLYERAIADFDRAIEIEPGSGHIYCERARSWRARSEPGRAAADFTRAIDLNPRDAIAYKARAEFLTEMCDHDGAIADCNSAIALDENDADAYCYRADAYAGKRDLVSALADYEAAIRLAPHDASTRNNRGFLLMHLGHHDQAISDFNKAIELLPGDSRAYNNRGRARLEMGDIAGAMADLNRAVELNPKSPKAFRNRAAAWLARGEYHHALADATRSISLNPNEAPSFVIRSEAREALGDGAGAAEDILRARILGPQPPTNLVSPVSPEIVIRDRTALRDMLANDTPENRSRLAIARHARALAILDAQDGKSDRTDIEEAIGYAQSATALEPGIAAHLFLAGLLFHKLAEHDERAAVMAEQALRAAADAEPEHAGAWLQLGMMMMEQRRDRAAVDAFERAIESDPARTAVVATGPLCAVYALNGEADRGLDLFRELYAANPEVSALGVGIAILLDHLGNREAAALQAEAIMAIEEPGTPEHDCAAGLAADWEGAQQ